MSANNEIINYKNQNYILCMSENILFHPSKYNISPVWSTSDFEYESTYKVEEYKLLLQSFKVKTDSGYPKINNISPRLLESGDSFDFMEYKDIFEPLDYTGAVVIVNEFMHDYGFFDYYPCYCYKNVFELIFAEGVLVTTINHNRAMNKIRKNIDAGLRNPKNKTDNRCINRFIKYSLVGDYHTNKDKRKLKYILDVIKNKKKIENGL